MIAVLIPSYKPQAYLERCLQALEHQTLDKNTFVVYVALNGPKDGYEQYIQRLLTDFSFQYKYMYLDKASVSNARNQLIEFSTEPFITFIDDDDVVSQNYLEQLLAKAEERIISVSNVFNFSDSLNNLKKHYIGVSFNQLSEVEFSQFTSRKYFSTPWAKLIHRNLIGSTRFNTRLAMGEDSLFMAELSYRVHGIRKTDESACYYVCERQESATRKKVNKWQEFKRIHYLLYKYSLMLLGKQNKLFVLTRIAATVMHVKRLLRS